jgi:hypothetical protein
MSKIITIKLTKVGIKMGPFTIYDQFGNIIASLVSRETLITGISYLVDDSVSMITLTSTGECIFTKTVNLSLISPIEYNTPTIFTTIACLWRHLTNTTINNSYYGITHPYIIEYPFSYSFQDEILQNVKDYTKAYKYLPDGTGVFAYTDKIEVDNEWFNKVVLYNGQQSTGILELVPKPKHNLQQYLSYPIFNTDSKTITYTKSDNFYQYNTFWSIVKNKSIPLFITSCESLSVDKIVNQVNMDYSTRSFKKEPLRAKELKIRQMLTNKSDVHLVSHFIINGSMISYK